ncbi:MAG: alpha/beta hydrolase [Planktotalea sp.]|uniref:alpha/beta hydrolase n=1 Tax=Planktotalea sp. TaxID=2029877 RepID=UPI003C749B2C
MRAFLLAFALCLPLPSHAGLLDLLPLKRIERKMIYPLSAVEVDPAALGLLHSRAHSVDRDGRKLVVWSIEATRSNAPTVLYFHGNAGNLANRASRFAMIQAQGFNVIAMSYPGSSGSEGVPSEAMITSDALHVYQNAASLLKGTQPRRLIVYGESLGSALAVALLANLAPSERPGGIILEAPFTSTPDMARAMTDVPDNLISRIQDRWDTLARASALTVPLLVIHGSADEVTPPAMGRAVFAAAPVGDKDFLFVQGASHSGTWRTDTTSRIWRFIGAYAAP